MQENSNQIIIMTKGVVLPFGFSKVPEVIDQEEESKLIDAIKENKEIIFVYKGENGLSEYGCTAKVSSYDYLSSYTKIVRSKFKGLENKLNNEGYFGLPIFYKSDLVSDINNLANNPNQFTTLDEIELLLIDVVLINHQLNHISTLIQNNSEANYNVEYLERLNNIISKHSVEHQFDCFHTLSFYTLTKIMSQNTLHNNLVKQEFLKINSETQRSEKIIKLYETKQLFSK